MNFNLKTAIGTIAPTLATMLGGPLAGTAVAALTQALGLGAGSTADDVTKAVAAGMTPDQIAMVRKADQEHAEVMKQKDIDLVKLNLDFEQAQDAAIVADRDSARKMQIANHSVMPALLTAVLTIGFFVVLLARMYSVLPGKDDPMVNQMIGSMLAIWGAAVTYWVGTTRGSANKDNTVQALAAQSAKPAV